jgi:hypothetical protein
VPCDRATAFCTCCAIAGGNLSVRLAEPGLSRSDAPPRAQGAGLQSRTKTSVLIVAVFYISG